MNPDGNVHTVPTSGLEHEESQDCWCEPILDYEDELTGIKHYIHKGYLELDN